MQAGGELDLLTGLEQRFLDPERRAAFWSGGRRGRSAALQSGEAALQPKASRCRWCWVSTPPRKSSTRRSSALGAGHRFDGRRLAGVEDSSPLTIADREMDFDYFTPAVRCRCSTRFVQRHGTTDNCRSRSAWVRIRRLRKAVRAKPNTATNASARRGVEKGEIIW